MRRYVSTDLVGIITCAGMGVAAVAAAFATGIPGNGIFLAVAWLAGVGAVVARPGWTGVVTLMLSITAAMLVADLTDGVLSGLFLLAVASLLVPAAHGALVAYIGRRGMALGPGASLRDARMIVAVVAVVLVAVGVALVAQEFARNPP
jgi:hypothetical protein